MEKYARLLNLPGLIQKKSHFLFGPRATGKSTLVRQQLPQAEYINLLDNALHFKLLNAPQTLETLIDPTNAQNRHVVIDEVQLVPQLLNEVHRLIEEKGWHFLLTGSSARKLKRGQANLLAGRAREAQLFPLTYHEIPHFDLERYLSFGGLPSVYQSEEPYEDLHAYVNTYLKEEIQAEAHVRKIPSFAKFLNLSALTNGQMLNFTQIASDAAVTGTAVREYYYLLEDTFMGFFLPSYKNTMKRKAVSTAKFYYFDIGVVHALKQLRGVLPNSEDYGWAFEHFIGMELRAYLSYQRLFWPLTYWQTPAGREVDFIVGDHLAIEVKATSSVQKRHLSGLMALAEENQFKHLILVSQDPNVQRVGPILVLPWRVFLDQLWGHEFN